MTKKSYYIGISLNLLLFLPCILLLTVYAIKGGTNSPAENYELMMYGLLIALFAMFNIVYGLIFIIKSEIGILKKVIYGILILIGILPPFYLIFPIFQFTVFRNMIRRADE